MNVITGYKAWVATVLTRRLKSPGIAGLFYWWIEWAQRKNMACGYLVCDDTSIVKLKEITDRFSGHPGKNEFTNLIESTALW